MASGTIAIIKLGLFYYDVLKGISLISMLNQVEFSLLEDVEGTTEYDFGGLNFKVTKYHLVIVLIISEMLRNGYMQNIGLIGQKWERTVHLSFILTSLWK